jgi:methionine biosynthesis protein MetW
MYPPLYEQVIAWIPENSRVLDLGTGDGVFLERLIRAKQVRAEGVERDPELVSQCIERGLVVHQGDLLDGLDQYAAASFDCVLLLGTFQELEAPLQIMREAFRVGRRMIVAYANFAHVRARCQLLFRGQVPVTRALPARWYETPNLHFCSVLDFQDFCRRQQLQAVHSAYFNPRGRVRFWPNLFSDQAVTWLEADGPAAPPASNPIPTAASNSDPSAPHSATDFPSNVAPSNQ